MRFARNVTTLLAVLSLAAGTALAGTDHATVTLQIKGKGDMEGMVCEGCQARVKKALEGVEGVAAAEVDLAKQQAVVTYDPEVATVEALQKAVEEAGFVAVPKPADEEAGLAAAVVEGDTCCGNCPGGACCGSCR